MQKQLFLLLILHTVVYNLINAQIYNNSQIPLSINADGISPEASAILDIQSPDKGILIPRMNMSGRDLITSPVTGLLIYQIDASPGFYYFDGTSWQPIVGSATVATNLLADADTDTKIQVEESVDEDLIRFDLMGTEHFVMDGPRLEVKNSGGSVFIGTGSGLFDDLTNNENTFIGDSTGYFNLNGSKNVAVGYSAFQNNTSGYQNTVNGHSALKFNIIGHQNTAIGHHGVVPALILINVPNVPWNGGIPVGSGSATGDGVTNTAGIVMDCLDVGIAATICGGLVLDTFDDWFLPSIGELALMYTNLHGNGYGDFVGNLYWSSTESDVNTNAWELNFLGGNIGNTDKINNNVVRAARAF